MIGQTSAGNPGVVAGPINWNATLVERHLVLVNTIFATIQLLIGLGIAWRPTVRLALAASIAVVARRVVVRRGPRRGAERRGEPGERCSRCGHHLRAAGRPAVAADRITASGVTAPFVAARAVGATVARVLWLVLWGSLAYFALTPGNRAPQALHDMVAGMASGEPGWLAALDKHAAALLAGQRAGRLDRAGRRARDRRDRGVPAALAGQGHADPGHRGGRGHLGVRRGVRRDPDRRRHRPELRSAARPAGPGLLAARHRRRRRRRPAGRWPDERPEGTSA